MFFSKFGSHSHNFSYCKFLYFVEFLLSYLKENQLDICGFGYCSHMPWLSTTKAWSLRLVHRTENKENHGSLGYWFLKDQCGSCVICWYRQVKYKKITENHRNIMSHSTSFLKIWTFQNSEIPANSQRDISHLYGSLASATEKEGGSVVFECVWFMDIFMVGIYVIHTHCTYKLDGLYRSSSYYRMLQCICTWVSWRFKF